MDAIGDIAVGGWTDESSPSNPVGTTHLSTSGMLGATMVGGDSEADQTAVAPEMPGTDPEGSEVLGATGMGWSMLGGDIATAPAASTHLAGLLQDATRLAAVLTTRLDSASDANMMGSSGLGWGMLGGDIGETSAPPSTSAPLSGSISDITTLNASLIAQNAPRLQSALTDSTTLAARLTSVQVLKIVDLTTLTGTLRKQTLVEIDGDVFASAMRTLSWSATVPTSQQVTGNSYVAPDVGHPIYYS